MTKDYSREAFAAYGKRGGKARARKLTKAQLSKIGKLGAAARWKNRPAANA